MPLHGKQRIGLMVPPANTTIEDDFDRWLPDSVRVHVNRMYSPPTPAKTLVEALQAYGDHVEDTARTMAQVPLDVMAFGCTSGSFLNGVGYDAQIIDKIESVSGGVRTVATAKAVADALRELGIKKIAACSPYPPEVNERLRQYYADSGFEIVNFQPVDSEKYPMDYNQFPPEVAMDLALSVDRPEAEAIFMSCTAFKGAAESIDAIEEATGKPVVTANQATFWACMRVLGVEESIQGGGVLMRERVAA